MSAEAATELADDLSFALMLALERLSPLERAAFLLHDVFDRPFSEVAQMVDRSEAACRQLAARARRAVRDEHPAPAAAPESHARLLSAFCEAATVGALALVGIAVSYLGELHAARRPCAPRPRGATRCASGAAGHPNRHSAA